MGNQFLGASSGLVVTCRLRHCEVSPPLAALRQPRPRTAARVRGGLPVSSLPCLALPRDADVICSWVVSYVVDFVNVSSIGLESSPISAALAGLRAHEARYFKNKYDHVFTVEPAAKAKAAIDLVQRILKEERGITITSPPLEATTFQVENIRWTYVFYENGLSINVLYALDGQKRAVGFKLSEGMEVPDELGSFKFARQKSKLAGTIRGSYFVIKGEH
jgi:hypothetical protein